MFVPADFWNLIAVVLVVYFELSEKNASSAVTRLRRSDFMAVTYAFDLVLANFGIAIAAKMPMMTTTISSSMSVKPLRLRSICLSMSNEKVGARGSALLRAFEKAMAGPTDTNLLMSCRRRV